MRLERLPNSFGISPLNSLLQSSISASSERLPSSGGIAPVSALPPRFSSASAAKSPTSGGSSPLSWFTGRTSRVTQPSPSAVTPCHWPMGASLSHPELFSQLGPSVAW